MASPGKPAVFSPSTVAHPNAEPKKKSSFAMRRETEIQPKKKRERKKNQPMLKRVQEGLLFLVGVQMHWRWSALPTWKCCIRSQGPGGKHVCSRSTCCYARSETVKKHIALHTLAKRSDQITKELKGKEKKKNGKKREQRMLSVVL